jgi:hypothetical protein
LLAVKHGVLDQRRHGREIDLRAAQICLRSVKPFAHLVLEFIRHG